MTESHEHSTRKIGLDLVRAVAVAAVLACHFLAMYTALPRRWLWPLGAVGVEIFFALSGYLIGGILLRSIRANGNRLTLPLAAGFWARRWLRTLPVYWVFLVLAIAFRGFGGPRDLLANLTFTQGLNRTFGGPTAIAWSLAVEEWFYLLFPLAVLAFATVTTRARHAFLAAVAVLFVAPLVVRLAVGPGLPWTEDVRKRTVFRLDSIMWGVLVACVEQYAPGLFNRLARRAALWAGVAGCAAATAYAGSRFAPGAVDFVATRADVLLILPAMNACCAMALPGLSRVRWRGGRASAAIRATSLWSYSLYLFHLGAIFLVGRVAARVPGVPAAVWAVAALALSFAVAAAMYRCVERPALRFRDRHFDSYGRRIRRARSDAAVPVGVGE